MWREAGGEGDIVGHGGVGHVLEGCHARGILAVAGHKDRRQHCIMTSYTLNNSALYNDVIHCITLFSEPLSTA